MKRTVRFVPLTLALLAGGSAYAKPLPNFDAALSATPASSSAARAASSAAGTVASVDEQRGVPSFFWAAPPPSAGLASSVMSAAPTQIARAFVKQTMGLYGLSAAALDTMFVREVHDTGRGGIIVLFGQRVGGVDVFENEMKVLMNRQGDIVAVSGNLHPSATAQSQGASRAFRVPEPQAIANAFADLTGIQIQRSSLLDTGVEKDGYSYFDLAPTAATRAQKLMFTRPSRAKKVFYPMPDRIVPGYYLEIDLGATTSASSDLWGYVIAADTGELLLRRHLTFEVAFNYKVWGEAAAPFTPLDGPIADWTPHPTGLPDGSAPSFIAPATLSIDGLNTNPSNTSDPWLAANATVTTGNNVDAYADIGAPDGFSAATDIRANTTSANTFDYTYNLLATPNVSPNQIKASVTELFYMNNWLHDYFYDSGFNEAAGNAQTNNFGRGGAQNDPIHAECQDYSGLDNANMSTPADGQSPRMQMYVFTGSTDGHVTVQPLNISLNSQPAAFGLSPFSVTAPLILGVDGNMVTPTNTDLNDACEALINNVTGKIVLVNRGTCTFESKVQRAQQAGAVGVLITNNVPVGLPGMADDPNTTGVTIGSLGISQADGDVLKTALMNQALTVSMSTDPPQPNRDGTLDNQIVAHEWGHYIHHRLVASCTTVQCGGESEGWGDFNSMLMTVRPGDNVATGTFAAAIYASAAFGDEGYFGIRRFPYTRDLAKNGLTFKHVTNGVALPAGPQNPAGPDNWEVHNSGEVWASMLFQAYTELLISGGHPFAEAKRRMADYFVAGMKLAPANPTFTQQRDGILAAARAADLNDAVLLAKGFAARGAGTCAVSPPSNSSTGAGVVEDFTTSGVMQIVTPTVTEVTSCDNDGVVDAGETGKLNVKVWNAGLGPLTGPTTVTVSTATPGVLFPNGPSAVIGAIGVGATGTASIDISLSGAIAGITDADFTISVNNNIACAKTVQSTFSARMNYNDVPNSSTTESVESPQAPWTPWGAPGYEALSPIIWTKSKDASNNYQFHGQNYAAVSDTALESPDLIVSPNQSFVVSFAHAFDFDYTGGPARYWDGGVVEITTNGGQSWQDAAVYAAPGYNNVIYGGAGTTNLLAGRNGYVRQNAAWPGTNNVALNMGNALAGKTVKIRFRIGSDAVVHSPNHAGWYIDDIAVQGITNLPFHTVVANLPGCNQPPKANAGIDLIVNEGAFVALDGSASSDANNDPLTYAWQQTVGPVVMLSNPASIKPTFTAPQVAVDTPLTFKLTVGDGLASDVDTVNVLVLDVVGTGGAGGMGSSSVSGAGGMGSSSVSGAGGMGSSSVSGVGGMGSSSVSGVGGMGSSSVSGVGGMGSSSVSGVGGMGSSSVSGVGGMGSSSVSGAGGKGSSSVSGAGGKGSSSVSGAGGMGGGTGGVDPTTFGGCDCEAAGTSRSSTGASFGSLLAAAMFLIRRRRSQKVK